jgi:anti-sigma factor RsiW
VTSYCDGVFAMWDAAYVLGSLSAADRREFEVHMANCPACRDAVADLSGVPALLSQLDREEVAAIDHMSVTELLAELGAAGGIRRRRSRSDRHGPGHVRPMPGINRPPRMAAQHRPAGRSDGGGRRASSCG